MDIIKSYKEHIDKIIDKTYVIGEPLTYKEYIFDIICNWLSTECVLEHIDSDIMHELRLYAKERLA